MGIAIRSGSPLSLNLAEPMWKLLAGSPLNTGDLAEVSKLKKIQLQEEAIK